MTTATQKLPRAVLVHGPGFDVDGISEMLEAEDVVTRRATDPLHEMEPGSPTVLVLDDTQLDEAAAPEQIIDALPPTVVVVTRGERAQAIARTDDRFFTALPERADSSATLGILQTAFRHAATRLGSARAEAELARTRDEVEELNEIGMALMTERDPDLLLDKILSRSMSMTGSDAGSLYLVEDAPDEAGDRLRFKLSRNDSLPELPAVEFTLPIDMTSIAGYVAVTGEPLVLDDAYQISDSAPYSFNRGFDEQFGYRAMSMLVVPMADHRGEVVGVLQLINRKRDPAATITGEESAAANVLPYEDHELSIVRGLAGQAAVSIENARLYEQIEDIFESFVKAAVAAIDQRDPTTAGHSVRVAALTTRMADRLPRLSAGRWAGTSLTRDQMKELRYAALLHDFGKVGVREEVLVKAKKLPPYLWERVNARFDLIHRTLEKQYLEKKVEALRHPGSEDPRRAIERLDEELNDKLGQLESYREAVADANEPSVLPEEGAVILNVVAGEVFERPDGGKAPYLAEEELSYLTISKGSLDQQERKEIESHVTQTYRFLTQIPWTEDLRDVAAIAYAHHEKLDGRGYPRGIMGEEIPVQTRIMTIADIFDALTASDRPYKRALGADRALGILESEAQEGMLDTDLVEMLVESRVYQEVLETDWREL